MTAPTTGLRWRHWGVGGGLLAVLGWFAFARGVKVPLLSGVDLFVHEAGHLLAVPLPALGEAAMGSALQVAVPLVFVGGFLVRERDLLGATVSLGWAATALQDVSVYVADAPHRRLTLIGGGTHDWAFVLGRLGLVDAAADIARAVWLLGLVALVAAVAAAASGPWLDDAVRAGRWPPGLSRWGSPRARRRARRGFPGTGVRHAGGRR